MVAALLLCAAIAALFAIGAPGNKIHLAMKNIGLGGEAPRRLKKEKNPTLNGDDTEPVGDEEEEEGGKDRLRRLKKEKNPTLNGDDTEPVGGEEEEGGKDRLRRLKKEKNPTLNG